MCSISKIAKSAKSCHPSGLVPILIPGPSPDRSNKLVVGSWWTCVPILPPMSLT